jgi:hypothetical protein
MGVGSTLGSLIPTLFGVSAFSFLSNITTAIGSLLAIWGGYRIATW